MTNTLIPFAGSGLVGYAMGFALCKIIKWLMIIFGILAGSFFLGIVMLQKYGYVGDIKWCSVFATCKPVERLSPRLLSRFGMKIKPYTVEEFKQVTLEVLHDNPRA
jgi:uncharacterized membrane protein (Fun14 family)